jgi:hypothetical protein
MKYIATTSALQMISTLLAAGNVISLCIKSMALRKSPISHTMAIFSSRIPVSDKLALEQSIMTYTVCDVFL